MIPLAKQPPTAAPLARKALPVISYGRRRVRPLVSRRCPYCGTPTRNRYAFCPGCDRAQPLLYTRLRQLLWAFIILAAATLAVALREWLLRHL